MRLQSVMLSVVFGLFVLPQTPVHAQIGEAVAAFKSAVRDANRALNPRPYKRRRKPKLRSTLVSDQTPPPLPQSNPQRRRVEASPRKNSRASSRGVPTNRNRAGQKQAKLEPPAKPGATTTAATRPRQVPVAPPPDIWTEEQIAKAQKQCRAILRKVHAKLVPADPIKKGPCGDAAPYRLASLGKKHPVVFSPAPVLNCRMIQALDTWLRKGLQPLARKHLGSPITRVSVMSSYSCRNAYGRKKTRLSEHGKANALDIGGFRTRGGVSTRLLADWGPTQRDIIAKAKREEAARAAEIKRNAMRSASNTPVITQGRAAKAPAASQYIAKPRVSRSNVTPVLADDGTPPPLPLRRPSLSERLNWAKAEQRRRTSRRVKAERGDYKNRLDKFLFPRQDLGGPKVQSAARQTGPAHQSQRTINKEAFLKGAHHTACKIFGTVLGPEANDAHRDHFHVDMAPRRYRNYCR